MYHDISLIPGELHNMVWQMVKQIVFKAQTIFNGFKLSRKLRLLDLQFNQAVTDLCQKCCNITVGTTEKSKGATRFIIYQLTGQAIDLLLQDSDPFIDLLKLRFASRILT